MIQGDISPVRSPSCKTEIEIRRATAEDVRLLSALSMVTFFEAYFEQDDPHELADYLIDNFSTEVISADLEAPSSSYFVAMRDGHAVGYAKLRDGQPHESVGENAVELQRFYLVERVWGSGVGKLLLDHCIAAARTAGKGTLWLGVWEQNVRGLSFYRKHGFQRVGRLTFPYGDTIGINAVMQIRL